VKGGHQFEAEVEIKIPVVLNLKASWEKICLKEDHLYLMRKELSKNA